MLRSRGVIDYKFYCFDGEPKYLMVSCGEAEHLHINHKYDLKFNSIDSLFREKELIPANVFKKPENYDAMVEIVKKLCKNIPHIRIDLYNIDGSILFGEMTFFTNAGFINIPYNLDRKIGNWIDLANINLGIS